MNTTGIAVTMFDDCSPLMTKFSKEVNLDFRKISDNTKCGGPKNVSIATYAYCGPCLTYKQFVVLVDTFKKTQFIDNENASLTISDDNDKFNCVILHPEAYPLPFTDDLALFLIKNSCLVTEHSLLLTTPLTSSEIMELLKKFIDQGKIIRDYDKYYFKWDDNEYL